jgi:hypothetical protein
VFSIRATIVYSPLVAFTADLAMSSASLYASEPDSTTAESHHSSAQNDDESHQYADDTVNTIRIGLTVGKWAVWPLVTIIINKVDVDFVIFTSRAVWLTWHILGYLYNWFLVKSKIPPKMIFCLIWHLGASRCVQNTHTGCGIILPTRQAPF